MLLDFRLLFASNGAVSRKLYLVSCYLLREGEYASLSTTSRSCSPSCARMHKAEPYATAHARDRGVLLLVRLVGFFQMHMSVVGGESTGGQHRQREPQPADRVTVPCTIAGDRCRRRPDHAVCGRQTQG